MQHVRGPLLVLGGAGSGKTSLLACKIAWLIRELDVDPAQIIAFATSTHAKHALRCGAEEILGRKLPTLSVLGFPDFGLQLIERRCATLGLRPGFTLYDRADSEAAIAKLLQQAQPRASSLASAVARQISYWKRGFASPTFTTDAPDLSVAAVAAWSYQRYEQRLLAANAVDLEDLVRKAVRLLTTDSLLLTRRREQTRFLLIDEYERTSACEHELVRLLAAEGMGLTAAGDNTHTVDDRPFDSSDSLARLASDVSNPRIITLERNFRCSGRIAVALNRIIGGASGFSDAAPLYGPRPGTPIRMLRTRNEPQEAEGIVAALVAHQIRSGADYRGYAIVFRHLEQSPVIERALRVARVPYHLHGAPTFFAQPEIRDLWAYLRVLSNPADDDAFVRTLSTPRRDIDHATIARLAGFAAACGQPMIECALDPEFTKTLMPEAERALRANLEVLTHLIERAAGAADPADLARHLLDELRYLDWLRDTCNDAKIAAQRMSNVTRALDMLQRASRRQPDAGLRSIFPRLQLQAMSGGGDDETAADGVELLTFDAARGAECKQLYLVGFEETLPPATETDGDALGERHLAYLLLSRAREGVTLTITEQRRLAGVIHAPRASRLLADLPPHDLQWIGADVGQAFAENSLANSATYTDLKNHRPP